MHVPKCQMSPFFRATQSQEQQQQLEGLSAAPATIKNGQVLKLGYTQKKTKETKKGKEK